MVPGKSFLARDLIRGGEPVRVLEVSGTKTLKQKDLPQSVAIATLDHPSIPKGVAKKNSDGLRHRYKGQDHNDPHASTHTS